MTEAKPFISSVLAVEPAWIDYNGHMNMAYYNVLFDRCADEAFAEFGVSADYVRDRGMSVFTAEIHVCYVRELHEGDKVTVSFQMLDHDDKRIRVYQEIRHEDGWLAATGEALSLHVDMSGPKVTPFPDDVKEKVQAMQARHATLPMPERAGRSIAIKRKPETAASE
ncbi:thioesterase [Zhengella mangrovi]|uniref:Thioesterase n=1 Tax=Zhengella mangrovi TaxID=1982044 RepID=A0A2G1QQ17_9HYPH|nr:thioesterase family protein [Zhengella mangrovi]PHP67561.1 thioesterase [Zhengella mangrovi]